MRTRSSLKYAKKIVTHIGSCSGKEIDRKVLERFDCPGTSWRKILITQPTGLKVGSSYIRELRKAGDPGSEIWVDGYKDARASWHQDG